MTTLPQTTPLRLPRPSGSGQIAIPGAPQGALGLQPASGQMTASDVWRVFRSNWWLILLVVIATGVAGFFVNRYLAQHYPRYTAPALVKVQLPEEVFGDRSEEGSATPQSIEVEQKTQVQGLLSPGLMLDVLTKSDKIRQTEWFKEFNNSPEAAKENLLQYFSVRPIPSTRLISVEMTYKKPGDARTIVEEIINRYIADQKEKIANAWTETARNLDDQYNEFKRTYNKIGAELTNTSTSRSGTMASFDLYGVAKTKEYELTLLTNTRMGAERDLRNANNEYLAMQAMIDSGGTPPEVEAEIMRDSAIARYQAEYDVIANQIAVSGNSQTPLTAGMFRRRQVAEQKLNDERESRRNSYLESKRFKVKTELDTAKEALQIADESIKRITKELLEVQAIANKYRMLELEQDTVKKNMDDIASQRDKIRNRKLPSNWSPVTMFSPPPTPDTPSFPKLGITMSIAVLLGPGSERGHRVPPRDDRHHRPLAARHRPRRPDEPAGHDPARSRRPAGRRRPHAAGHLRRPALDDGRAVPQAPHAAAARGVARLDPQHPGHQPQPRRRQDHGRLQPRRRAWRSTAGGSCWSTPTSAARRFTRSSRSPTSVASATCSTTWARSTRSSARRRCRTST